MNSEENRLIEGLRQGRESAYRELFDKHYVILCKVACEFLKDDFLAETIVGDVIVSVWRRREELEITTSLRGYLIRAVRYQCINHLDREYVRREVSESKMNEHDLSYYHYHNSDYYPLGTLLERELESKIEEAVVRLPEECRKVFRLSRVEEKSYLEIAEEVGISVNTVKYHMKNALSRLSEELGKYLLLLLTTLWLK